MLVPEALCPLQELEIVLHLALDELLDRDGAINVVLAESVAQNLEIVQVGVVGGSAKFDTVHGHIDWGSVSC